MEPLKRSGTALHHQILLLLREAIQSGRYRYEKFPTENELMQQFGVCRFTVRRALENLKAAGLIERRQGVGSIVMARGAEVPLQAPIATLVSNLEAFDADSTVEVIESKVTRPTVQAREMLRFGEDCEVLQLVRVRHRNGRPVLQATHSVPRPVSVKIRKRDLHMPIYRMLDQAVGVSRIEQTVSAVLANPIVAERLEMAVGSALISVNRTYHRGEEVVACTELLASPAACQVRMVLSGPESSGG